MPLMHHRNLGGMAMNRRCQGALIAAIILLAALTYVAAAAGHPMYLIDPYDLETP
jgi:hypothetical protein